MADLKMTRTFTKIRFLTEDSSSGISSDDINDVSTGPARGAGGGERCQQIEHPASLFS